MNIELKGIIAPGPHLGLILTLAYPIRAIVATMGFDPNTETERARDNLRHLLRELAASLVAKQAINDFNIECDASNNTPVMIERGVMCVFVGLKPTPAPEAHSGYFVLAWNTETKTLTIEGITDVGGWR